MIYTKVVHRNLVLVVSVLCAMALPVGPAQAQEGENFPRWGKTFAKSYNIEHTKGMIVEELAMEDKDCVLVIGDTLNDAVGVSCRWHPRPGTVEWWYSRASLANVLHGVAAFLRILEPE